MLTLRTERYKWALTHLLKEGDTDLFPKPFEFDVLANYPDEVERSLQKIDIDEYPWFPGRRILVPKGMVSFRTATQLDPWDSLVLTALIREFGDLIERKRISDHEEIVFSYRFHPMSDGTMYRIESGWSSFLEKSKERAISTGGYVAVADVSNYYNQIYHPRLEKLLHAVGINRGAVDAFIRLFAKLTNGVQRGLPIGPHATHLLAECAFDPIDKNLLIEGYSFCRFVDDIHIFCKTKQQARVAFYDLANILDREQQLSIQAHKSKILSVEEFIEYTDRMITEAPSTSLERAIIEVIDRYSNGDPYRTINYAILSPEDLSILSQHNLETVLRSYLVSNEPNFTHIRWLFRRFAQVGVPGAVPFAIENLEQLSPAVEALANYLISACFRYTGWEHLGEQILHDLSLPIIQRSEYLKIVLLNLFAHISPLDHKNSILQKYHTEPSNMVKRKIIRVATTHKADYWLHQQKEERSDDPWLKRAFIASGSAFSKNERVDWLKRFEKEATELEKFIAGWAKTEEGKNNTTKKQSPTPVQKEIEITLSTRRDIFICYSHIDKIWLDKLQTMIKPWVQKGTVKVWSDDQIKPGDKWRDETNKALASTKVAVLLVTPAFLASDFITKHELPPLLDAAKKEDLTILWVAVRKSMYNVTEIEKYQAINDPERPLSSLRGAKQEQELLRISEVIVEKSVL